MILISYQKVLKCLLNAVNLQRNSMLRPEAFRGDWKIERLWGKKQYVKVKFFRKTEYQSH